VRALFLFKEKNEEYKTQVLHGVLSGKKYLNFSYFLPLETFIIEFYLTVFSSFLRVIFHFKYLSILLFFNTLTTTFRYKKYSFLPL